MTTRKLCYPHPRGFASHPLRSPPPYGLHPTLGLAHNWAIDYMAKGGTPVVAMERSTVWRLSGHDPREGVIDGSVFGWSVYLLTRDGLIYYVTHLGARVVKVGDRLPRSAVIGRVGSWPGDPGRSHTHCGVTHPAGEAASKRAARNVAEAPRVALAV